MTHSHDSKPPKIYRRQISLGAMLVVMLIFTLMSAALFYASRVEAIQDELSLYFGFAPSERSAASRKTHLIFLLFTYASPLMVAAVLSTVVGVLKRQK